MTRWLATTRYRRSRATNRRDFLVGSAALIVAMSLPTQARPYVRKGVSLADPLDIDDWAQQAGAYPDLAPVWCPLPTSSLPVGTFGALRAKGVEAMAYTRSAQFTGSGADRRPDPAWAYRTWLAGQHDDVLDAWAAAAADYGHRLIIRLDHEQTMRWCPWCRQDPELYIDAFHYIADRLRRAENVRMYWCAWGGTPYKAMEYYPGRACDFVGFDKYSRKTAWKPLAEDWRNAIRVIGKTGKRIIVGEFGRLAELPERGQWLTTLRGVDVWAAIYFDRKDGNRDWRMDKWMRRRFMEV